MYLVHFRSFIYPFQQLPVILISCRINNIIHMLHDMGAIEDCVSICICYLFQGRGYERDQYAHWCRCYVWLLLHYKWFVIFIHGFLLHVICDVIGTVGNHVINGGWVFISFLNRGYCRFVSFSCVIYSSTVFFSGSRVTLETSQGNFSPGNLEYR